MLKLWEKNYLLAFILFLLVLNGSCFLLVTAAFRVDLERENAAAVAEGEGICYLISNLYTLENGSVRVGALCGWYRGKGVYMGVTSDGGKVVVNTLPDSRKNQRVSDFSVNGIVKTENRKFLCKTGSVMSGNEKLEVVYARDISAVYRSQAIRLGAAASVVLLLSVAAGMILYITMKRIYRPVDNIAHELRTPLTVIQGYAQYLMAGKLKEEDAFFAGGQIYEESQNLKDVVDKLLIMGSLRGGSVAQEPVDCETLFASLNKRFPGVTVIHDLDYILGDETLLRSLLFNLVTNALRESDSVSVTAEGPVITVYNGGEPVSSDTLRRLNHNRPLPRTQIHGSGHGVSLCHEIAKLHKGKLYYESAEGAGTRAIVRLPERRIKRRG